ncbi:uncharacterized protein Z518_03495 [Rhinocladiella mackenziei CBS 650.93]|uniref:L-ornithine N(5)-monooxygenase n=1 Tax=Rhinocladiella mackenziei CBS 650.93 TaxID=1442369 RepID=A0A0D2HE45_9EURO|nr:uncharacterized protein Z518_03495 [Rhinocladiella mackenziei CBS 650.93]KIX08838.1 hypothetical protein Z518_03495 [Rhinocladiella mackenziei CBS 650.93]
MDNNTEFDTTALELVCIGFGTTALSVAIALHERKSIDKTWFLESQPQARWKPNARIPSERLRTSFLNDLVTSENPRSKFTFLNYLHSTNQLIAYANSSQLCPSREMFTDYLRWCAACFQDQVKFNKCATAVLPLRRKDGPVELWKVVYSDSETRQQSSVAAKQVVIAVGNQPRIPHLLSTFNIRPRVVHSSECLDVIPSVLSATGGKSRLAVVGDGQNAADVFHYLQGIREDHQVTWFTRDPVLQGMDETPFVVDSTKRPISKMGQVLPIELRRRTDESFVHETRSVINCELLKSIYEVQYTQSVKQRDSKKWKCQIKLQSQLLKAEETPDRRIKLSFHPPDPEEAMTDANVFDLVIAATGYERNEYKRLMAPLMDLLDGRQITVNREYNVNFRVGSLAPGCSIWLQGSFADGEDVSPIL